MKSKNKKFKSFLGSDNQFTMMQKSTEVIASENVIKSDQQNPFIANSKFNPVEVYQEIINSVFDMQIPLSEEDKNKAKVYYASAIAVMEEKMLPATAQNIRAYISEVKQAAENFINPPNEKPSFDALKRELETKSFEDIANQKTATKPSVENQIFPSMQLSKHTCSNEMFEKKYFGFTVNFWIWSVIVVVVILLLKVSNSNS